MGSPFRRFGLLLWVLGCFWVVPTAASPFYSAGSGHACDTCHIEPIGWKNPEVRDRRCTLDCQGCHVSPTGGGLRTPSGRYYGEQTMVRYGTHPGDGIDATVYLPKGFPAKGSYSLKEGFRGWWPGKLDHRTIQERYGVIDPNPKFSAGGDIRLMSLAFAQKGRFGAAAFPMEAQLYLSATPSNKFTAYADVGVRGSQQSVVPASALDALWVREVFVMRRDMPYNGYVRAGRFSQPYGWRIQDHTAFIRAGRFDQFRQGYGVEYGVSPNEGWGNIAAWRQGLPGWPGDVLPGGLGVTAQGGVRRLGYQAGLSAHYMRADRAGTFLGNLFGAAADGTDEIMVGPMWAVNYYPFVYLGEADYRRTIKNGVAVDSWAVFNEVHWEWRKGVTPKVRLEAIDQNIGVPSNTEVRMLLGAELNPYKYAQFDIATRIGASTGGFSADFLLQVHSWIR
jgi:hypothetical protein